MLELWLVPMRLTLGLWGFFGGIPQNDLALVRQVGHLELLAWDAHKKFVALWQVATPQIPFPLA